MPKELLCGYQGVAQTDAYAGYNEVFVPEGCRRLACLAHIRRKFIEAQASAGSECARILKSISEVYRAEASAKTHEARFAVRQARTRPLLEELFVFLKACMLKILPKSPFAQALSYAIKQEVEVMRIMESGVYELDNNSIERQMKYIVSVARTTTSLARMTVLTALLCSTRSLEPVGSIRLILGSGFQMYS